jgi:hypothetical protein
MHETQYTFNELTGYTAMGSASTLLMLRTIAVWNRSPRIVIPLLLASMGQWGMLIHGIVTIRSQWSDVERACIVETVSPKFMEVIFMYCELYPQPSLFPPLPSHEAKQDINVERRRVVRFGRFGAHNNWTVPFSGPVIPLATSFPTRHHILHCRICRQHGSNHFSLTEPQLCVFSSPSCTLCEYY